MRNILLIGCGNIGKRYLEDLFKDNNNFLYVVENNFNSIENAKILLNKKELNNVKFYPDLFNLYEEKKNIIFDFLIIATNSDIRFNLFKEANKYFEIKYIILEKVLFSKLDNYYEALDIIKNKNLKVWVNHPRRIFNFYKNLKLELKKNNYKILFFKYLGYNWNLLSNCLHMLDLYFYLNNEENIDEFEIDINIKKFFESKRKNFLEAYGEIILGNKNTFLVISDLNSFYGKDEIIIEFENNAFIILEKNSKMITIKDNMISEVDTPIIEYQSTISRKIIDEIFNNGSSTLPDYLNSMKLHLKFLECFSKKYNRLILGDFIPIT
ncbi:MAG: Gfo/Idh/MocA family oxidoreductase [Spirochaetes bacterium]|nr:Gfo/Idh/MocA family oxidoreductase [Spirochaetota bacterium]